MEIIFNLSGRQIRRARRPGRHCRAFEDGNQVTVAAQSGVMHDIPDGGKWLGSPAQPDREIKRQIIAQRKLPELLKRVAELEKKLGGQTE